MITRQEIEEAIQECEAARSSYQTCEKLATLYTVYDHLFAEPQYSYAERTEESVIGDYGDSEFLRIVRGRKAEDVWPVMDELMEALLVTNPRLYNGVIRKIAD